MTIETLVTGFALLVIGLALGYLVKLRFGWLIVVGLTIVLGALGIGYALGHGDGLRAVISATFAYVKELQAAEKPNFELINHVLALRDTFDQASVGIWLGIIGWLMLSLGMFAFCTLLTIEFARQRRAGETGLEPSKIKVDVDFS